MKMRAACLVVFLLAVVSTCAAALDSIDALMPAPAQVKIVTGYAPKNGTLTTKIDKKRTDLGEEGYVLVCDRKGYKLTAQTEKGISYGKITLNQMKRLGSIPCCTITDMPVMKVRGVMFDLPRDAEKDEYYKRIVDQLGQWKNNIVSLTLSPEMYVDKIARSSLSVGEYCIIPSIGALDNMKNYAAEVIKNDLNGMITFINREPSFIPGTLAFGLAYASELSWSGEKRGRIEFAKAFTRNYFGFPATTEFAQVLWNLPGLSMTGEAITYDLWADKAGFDRLSPREKAQEPMTSREKAKAALNTLKRYRKNVTLHKDDYDALILASETIGRIGDHAVAAYMLAYHLTEAQQSIKNEEQAIAVKHMKNAVELINGLIEQENNTLAKLSAAGVPADALYVEQMQKSKAYLKTILPSLKAAEEQVKHGDTVDWSGLIPG